MITFKIFLIFLIVLSFVMFVINTRTAFTIQSEPVGKFHSGIGSCIGSAIITAVLLALYCDVFLV